MSSIKIVQVVIEVDGQLCHATVPACVESMLVSLLQAHDDGKIHAVKLPASWKKVSLAEAVREEGHE
jgi:hypothetical protein